LRQENLLNQCTSWQRKTPCAWQANQHGYRTTLFHSSEHAGKNAALIGRETFTPCAVGGPRGKGKYQVFLNGLVWFVSSHPLAARSLPPKRVCISLGYCLNLRSLGAANKTTRKQGWRAGNCRRLHAPDDRTPGKDIEPTRPDETNRLIWFRPIQNQVDNLKCDRIVRPECCTLHSGKYHTQL